MAGGRRSEQSWAAARVCRQPALVEPPQRICSPVLLVGGSLDVADGGGVVAEEVAGGVREIEAGVVVLGMAQDVVVVRG